MVLTTDVSTGTGVSRIGRDLALAGRSRSSTVSRVEEDARVAQTTAQGVDFRGWIACGLSGAALWTSSTST
jgi:hypothetical protein